MEWGTLSGLAVRNDHSKDIEDLRYFDQLNKQNQAMLEAKNKMFMDDIDFQTASNPFDAGKIKEEGDAAIQQLANLTKAHPSDWMYNPDVQLRMKQIKQGMKSSPAVLRSIAYKDSIGKYNEVFQDAIKNPDKYDPQEISALRDKIANYDKFGHEDGQQGVEQGGGPKPLLFHPPTTRKSVDELYKQFDEVNPDQVVPFKNGNVNAYQKVLSDKAAHELAVGAYKAEPLQYKRFSDQGIDPIKHLEGIAKARVKPIIFNGHEPDNWKEKMNYAASLKHAYDKLNANPSHDIYKEMVVDKTNIPVNDSRLMQQTFGATPKVSYKGVDGKMVVEDGNEFHYTNLKDYDPSGKSVKTGLKLATGFITKPLQQGLDNGIVRKRHFWESGNEPYVIAPELADAYSIIYPPNGSKDEPVLQIKANAVIDANSGEAKSKYNAAIKSTNDYKNMSNGADSMIDQQVFEDDNGTKWTVGSNGKYVKVQ